MRLGYFSFRGKNREDYDDYIPRTAGEAEEAFTGMHDGHIRKIGVCQTERMLQLVKWSQK